MLEENLLKLEQQTESLIQAHQTLLTRYKKLQSDYHELNEQQDVQSSKQIVIKTKIHQLIERLKTIESNNG